MVVFMNGDDIAALGFQADEFVDLATAMDEAVERVVHGLRIVAYDIPRGCLGAYYPEVNALVPLSHHDTRAGTPAYKAIPVRLSRSAMSQRPQPEAMERSGVAL